MSGETVYGGIDRHDRQHTRFPLPAVGRSGDAAGEEKGAELSMPSPGPREGPSRVEAAMIVSELIAEASYEYT